LITMKYLHWLTAKIVTVNINLARCIHSVRAAAMPTQN